MRSFNEPTLKNLFRRPLVMGVPFSGLLSLAFLVLVLMILLGSAPWANAVTAFVALSGYVSLRICTRFLVGGWEDELFYPIERKFLKSGELPKITFHLSGIDLLPPDTLTKNDLIFEKEKLAARLQKLRQGQELLLQIETSLTGTAIKNAQAEGSLVREFVPPTFTHCYSLKSLPVTTNPLFMFELLQNTLSPHTIMIRITGMNPMDTKRKVEASRKRNAKGNSHISSIDSDVTFEETSNILEGMSRGHEKLAEVSMLILSDEKLDLDPDLFYIEKNKNLAFTSIVGLRKKHFRSHMARITTICDLIPNFSDPLDDCPSVLSTTRERPLYFSLQDPRLESLHWLVVGSTGTGKSFFVGTVLKRLLEAQASMSTLFVDHNRSFRRLVCENNGAYYEPQTLNEFDSHLAKVELSLQKSGSMVGIELSDLTLDEKKIATKRLMEFVEQYLRTRNTIHPLYLVLDECWNFIRDEPVSVQRAFREYRKLNGAVIAITQSLSDFMSDQTGKSIVQNAPIRILLRQGEDPESYRGILGLNDVEVGLLRTLKQEKGVFSECLIKTSFLSRLARLYPTPKEFEISRTDNLREEMVRENQKIKEISE